MCPSAPHTEQGAHVFAVVGGTLEEPSVSYLDKPLPMSPALVEMAGPVAPEEIFRISAPCAGERCGHFNSEHHSCRLATRTVALTPVMVTKPPRCAIRSQCVWWGQEGVSACLRCPQVVTHNYHADEVTQDAANPHNLRFDPPAAALAP
ncbi:MAG: nitrogen fixation protein [Aquabacterium sp.]